MGVRGLQTYLEQYCPSACYKVNLASLISEYRLKTGQIPEIVIDAQSCYKMWTQGIDWTIGFEIQEYIYRLETFVKAFRKIGVKLVFYFGGITPSKKRCAWIERRLRNIKDTFRVFDWFYSGNTLKDLPRELHSIPPNMGIITSFILKHILHCEVYMSVDECDEEIIHYVHKHKSYAIFGQDTDFIVSKIQCCVFSSNKFNIHDMTTLAYDRQKLIECLHIRNDQLPLLAVLAGNDLLPFDKLRAFHVRLCKLTTDRFVPFQVLIPEIGKFIKQLPDAPINEILQYISHNVFEDDSKLNDIKLSYSSYLIHAKPNHPPASDVWSQILRKAKYQMRNIDMPLCVWSVLNDQIFEIAIAFEDLRKIHDKCQKPSDLPSATITRPLRQRLYGILLKEKNDPSIVVEEWCGENDQSYREPVKVKPIYPTVHHPGLVALWSDDVNARLENQKWTLFLNAISPKIESNRAWSELDEDLLVAVAVCYYLYDQEFMQKWELHAMLATIVLNPLYDRQKLNSLPFDKPNMRAVQISVNFIRTYGIVVSLLAACGYCGHPVSLLKKVAQIPFEGRLFQVKYREAKEKFRFKQLCNNDEPMLKFFYRLKDIVYKEPKLKDSGERKSSTSSTDSNVKKSVASRLTYVLLFAALVFCVKWRWRRP